ncbi:MAG: glycosyl hydrolase 53 family protein [Bacilli bacterium]
MILGIDVSSYFEEIAAGAKYYRGDKEVDFFNEFKNNGVDYIRIRLWVDPYSNDGKHSPYLGGTNDLDSFINLSRIATAHGFKVLLDIHYSDFWCDPSKQTLPKSWANKNNKELNEAVYKYTKKVLETAKENNIDITLIQIGNEITNGMLWPNGRLIDQKDGTRTNYETVCGFLNSGIKAVKEVSPNSKIIIHLEKSFDNKIYNEYCENLVKYHVDYDILGVSYYPYWHHNFKDLFVNLDDIKAKFHKPIMIVETGYAFTLESYFKKTNKDSEKMLIDERFLSQMETKLEYPLSVEGQKDFIKELISLSKKHSIEGIFYWEPCWLPLEGICWSSEAGLTYIHEEQKTTRNEWANQCLFDYEGKMLPAFDEFRNK